MALKDALHPARLTLDALFPEIDGRIRVRWDSYLSTAEKALNTRRTAIMSGPQAQAIGLFLPDASNTRDSRILIFDLKRNRISFRTLVDGFSRDIEMDNPETVVRESKTLRIHSSSSHSTIDATITSTGEITLTETPKLDSDRPWMEPSRGAIVFDE